MVTATTGRGGRPPQGPISGKGATLATRITPELRRALDEEAEQTGRSVSQVAELALRQWHERNQLSKSGHGAISAAILKLEQLTAAIQLAVPDKRIAYFVTANTWKKAVVDLLGSAPVSDTLTAQMHTNAELIRLLGTIAKRIDAGLPGYPTSDWAKKRPPGVGAFTPHELMTTEAAFAVTSRLDDLVGALSHLASSSKDVPGEVEKAVALAKALQEMRNADDAAEWAGSQIADALLIKIAGTR